MPWSEPLYRNEGMSSQERVDRDLRRGNLSRGIVNPPGPKATQMLPWGPVNIVGLECQVPAEVLL